jgi:hypothetical protein
MVCISEITERAWRTPRPHSRSAVLLSQYIEQNACQSHHTVQRDA